MTLLRPSSASARWKPTLLNFVLDLSNCSLDSFLHKFSSNHVERRMQSSSEMALIKVERNAAFYVKIYLELTPDHRIRYVVLKIFLLVFLCLKSSLMNILKIY